MPRSGAKRQAVPSRRYCPPLRTAPRPSPAAAARSAPAPQSRRPSLPTRQERALGHTSSCCHPDGDRVKRRTHRRTCLRSACETARDVATRCSDAWATAGQGRLRSAWTCPAPPPQPGALASLVAIDALAPLVTLLRLDREGRDRARFEPLERDRLAGLLAIAVG